MCNEGESVEVRWTKGAGSISADLSLSDGYVSMTGRLEISYSGKGSWYWDIQVESRTQRGAGVGQDESLERAKAEATKLMREVFRDHRRQAQARLAEQDERDGAMDSMWDAINGQAASGYDTRT